MGIGHLGYDDAEEGGSDAGDESEWPDDDGSTSCIRGGGGGGGRGARVRVRSAGTVGERVGGREGRGVDGRGLHGGRDLSGDAGEVPSSHDGTESARL